MSWSQKFKRKLNIQNKKLGKKKKKDEDNELVTKIQMYLKLLSGEINADQLVRSLNLFEKYGLGEGQLAKTAEYVDRKK